MKASSKASIKKSERRNLPEDGSNWSINGKRMKDITVPADSIPEAGIYCCLSEEDRNRRDM